MSRIFDNANQLRQDVILRRIQPLDNDAVVNIYSVDVVNDNGTKLGSNHYVGIDSVLSDVQITSGLSTPTTAAELAGINRKVQSSKTARAIPLWATWTQAEADAWATLNIATPLASARTSLPATLTLATARAAFVVLLNILDKMWQLQKANAQMTLALRDEIWPDLPDK
jgi:hypothetical protein